MNSELDVLFSPSHWSKRPDVLKFHSNFISKETEKNRKEVPCALNIPYGIKERQKIDIYGTDLPKDASIFIFFHGGYWQSLNKDMSGYAAGPLYKNKIKTIIIGYTLCPDATLPEIMQEIEIAMRKCIRYAKENGSKGIYMSGYSAGSQLISYLFSNFYPTLNPEEKNLFKAVVLCCGVFDLTPLVNTSINDPLKLDHETAKSLSPLYHNVQFLNFKIFVVIGEFDTPALIKQSELYYKKIKKVSDATFKILKNIDHFNIVENYYDENYELVKYILKMEQ